MGVAIPFARIIPPVWRSFRHSMPSISIQQQCAPSTFLTVWKVPARSRAYTRFGGGTDDLYENEEFPFKLACRGGG